MTGDKIVMTFPAAVARQIFEQMPERFMQMAHEVYLTNEPGTMKLFVKDRTGDSRSVLPSTLIQVVEDREEERRRASQ